MKRLIPLALATFAVGTDGFVIAGLLPVIADDLDVSVAAAGQLVTVFALTFAISAPVLGWLTSSMDRRTVLRLALLVFVVGNIATALSTGYPAAFASRILAAVGAGMITSTASSTAVAITPPQRRGRALAFVLGGLTLSTALGLPLGMLVGRGDWHLTLWAVAGLGAVAAIGVWGLSEVVLPTAGLAARLAPLRDPRVLSMLLVTLLAMAGPYLLYTYIAAVTAEVAATPGALTVLLLAWGVGVLAGNLLSGRLVDRFSAANVVLAALVGGTVLLAISPLAVTDLTAAVVWAGIWGTAVGMPVVAQQHRLVGLAPASSPVLLGLNSSAISFGIAMGGAIGGLAQDWLPITLLGLVAAALTLIALPVTLADRRARIPARAATRG